MVSVDLSSLVGGAGGGCAFSHILLSMVTIFHVALSYGSRVSVIEKDLQITLRSEGEVPNCLTSTTDSQIVQSRLDTPFGKWYSGQGQSHLHPAQGSYKHQLVEVAHVPDTKNLTLKLPQPVAQ